MKRKIISISVLVFLIFSSCQDYLEVSSDSKLDSDFVFQSVFEAEKAILGAYTLLQTESDIITPGLFYNNTSVGSDIELGPELPSTGGLYNVTNCYPNMPQLTDGPSNSWIGLYQTINRCNIIIDAFENNKDFLEIDKSKPTGLGHLYGEAVAIRATMYFELTRAWGDVIHYTKPVNSKEDYADATITDRNVIQEGEIAKLIEVEPMMYHLYAGGDGINTMPIRMTKEYVQGLIARLSLIRGGYALRPANYLIDGDVIQTHPEWGKMVRRSDWSEYYQVANTYLKKLVNEGSARLVTSDPRTPSEKYSNPFQHIFQEGMDYRYSPEMIFEVSFLAGIRSDWPYSFGRPSNGGSTGYPPKAYGQIRFFPTYYYGLFHPKDLRRDVTVATTADGGRASEVMIDFRKGNLNRGGLALNKYSYSRMANKTYAVTQRIAGINGPYMRMGDMVLLLAETYAMLGDDGSAKAELLKIRQRAFDPNDPDYNSLTSGYVSSLNKEALLNAIYDERARELGGEGQRRFDLARWGIFGKKINELQAQMTEMITSLGSKKYYQFENGNVISDYILTKKVKKDNSGLADILTSTCYVDKNDPLYPLLYPGWRGSYTDWSVSSGAVLDKTIVAIKGLFEPLDDAEITVSQAAGYAKTAWGINLIHESWEVNKKGVFGGYLPSDYSANYPPRYLVPIPASTIVYSGGKITNSYGFPNE